METQPGKSASMTRETPHADRQRRTGAALARVAVRVTIHGAAWMACVAALYFFVRRFVESSQGLEVELPQATMLVNALLDLVFSFFPISAVLFLGVLVLDGVIDFHLISPLPMRYRILWFSGVLLAPLILALLAGAVLAVPMIQLSQALS